MNGLTLAGQRLSVAMTTELAEQLAAHLARSDGPEDLTFLLWRPSSGATRTTAIIAEAVWPNEGERIVHGNVSFTSAYFLRAAARAAEAGSGLALIHSHPGGVGWQGLSRDDHAAESGHAAQAAALTGLPLVGLTHGTGDDSYSARLWNRTGPRQHAPLWCENVRVVGDRISVHWNKQLRPTPRFRPLQARTVSAWGPGVQADLARLHVGVIGAGSVGALVAEALARVGIEWITLLDFDTVETVNLDRLLHAGPRDVRLSRAKVETLARALRRSSTAEHPTIEAFDLSVVEPEGLARALDCDVLFSCVDRPWPRSVLNLVAYAHLVPVIDGGILIRGRPGQRLRGAEWRAHLAAPGRACLECLGQYDPALVQAERAGLLDNPSYWKGSTTSTLCGATRTSSHSPQRPQPPRPFIYSPPSSPPAASATQAPTCTTSPPAHLTTAPTGASQPAPTRACLSHSATPTAWRSPANTTPQGKPARTDAAPSGAGSPK